MAIQADRILVIEDEPAIAEVLTRYLHDEGFLVTEAYDGVSGLERALSERPDLLLLDLHLPKLHGNEVLRRVRAVYDVPVIVVTSRIDEIDRIIGLELGADDYIGKPFSPREVVARVKTVLRRSRRSARNESSTAQTSPQRVGALEIDRVGHEVRLLGKLVSLTPTEFRILDVMAAHVGQALTRDQLLEHISKDGEVYDRTLDRHVGNLRRKIEPYPARPRHLMTVFGVGYKMVG